MITKGMACLATASMSPLMRLAAVNRLTPTGGVACPMARAEMKMTPYQSGSMPKAASTGIKIGMIR